jgi:hypothetical protein
MVDAFLTARFKCSLEICFALFLVIGAQSIAKADASKPILISEPTSTRAVALDAGAFTPQPFSPTSSSFFYASDKRTRVMLFVRNLALQSGEDLSAVTADAEDVSHRHYELKVEDVRLVPGQDWMSQIILRLNDDIGDVGDVLVGIAYRGIASNRVRVAIGHIGGGPPDDTGATPTPAPPYIISGRITSGTSGMGGVMVALSGPQTGTATTDNNGAYSFSVTSTGDYTVTPSKNFYTFTPSSKTFKDLSGSRTADFEAVPVTFAISGQIKDEENHPLSGATVMLTGSQQATTITDANGNYAFTNLMGGDNFTVVASKTDFSFTPASQTFNGLSANQTVNFSGALVFYTISGRIAESNNNGLPNVLVTASDGATASAVTTNESGVYTIALKAHGNYTVIPSAQFFAINPQQLTFNFLSANQTAINFTATRQIYSISGRVRGDQDDNLDGLSVTLKSGADNSVSKIINTSNGGVFSFTDLPAGYSYTVTPSNTILYAFTTQSTGLLDTNLSLNFIATRRKYTISGRVTNEQSGLDGVSLTLTGGNNLSQLTGVTSGGGYFSITGAAAGYDYTLTLASPFYAFNPQEFKNLLSDQTANFTGTLRSYTIGGLVADENNNPLSGIIVALYRSDGFFSDSIRVDANGRYRFTNITASYNYTVVPFDAATHTFTPQYIQQLGADQTLNFSGVRRYYTINGVIADRSRHGVSDVSVTLSGPFNRSATTDANGNYSFSNLPAGNYYTLNVAKTDYIFDPPLHAYELLKDEETDFTAIRTYRIAGRVTDSSGNGLIGMTMNLTGAETSKTLTGSDGSYSFIVTTVGDYLLTPSKEQNFYTFAPSSKNFSGLNNHQTANFTGTLSPATNPSYVLEFDGSRMTVDYGSFWPANVGLGHFFWEFWAMPGENTYTRYLLSDGYGGAHALLFGFLYSNEPGRYTLFGDIFDGTNTTYFLSDDGPVPGEWGHYAVGWDGKNIITYYDGVPIGKQPFVGPRISPGRDWGASMPLVGGSDHQNLIGRIAQVRGYEESNPHEGSPESSFAPQTLFSAEGQLMSYYFRPSQTVADLSSGRDAVSHPGVLRGFDIGYIIACPDCPTPRYVLDPTAPDFSNPGNPGQINAPFSGPPATPDSALVFDSFSRNNSTYILSGKGGLGITEGGSVGPQTWRTNVDPAQPQPFGILSGRAVLLANDTALAWVSTGSSTGNLDVRVDRKLGLYGNGVNTGLCFRVVDKNNFFFAYTSDDQQDSSRPKQLSIGYYQSGVRTNLISGIAMPSNSWKTLRVITTQSGSIKVYADDELIYSTTSPVFASAVGAGLYNNAPGLGLTNRWDNFTVLNVP